MNDDVIILRYLIKERNGLIQERNAPLPNTNQQYYVCGSMVEQLIGEMDAKELPEFLVSIDSLVRDCARDRISSLMGW